jgi:hypothetical protein
VLNGKRVSQREEKREKNEESKKCIRDERN